MNDHVSPMSLAIGFAIVFLIRSVALLAFLWVMIKVQKLNFHWLPLLGAALLAGALDMIPLVGHFLAVPVLYLCVWKITQCDLVPDATFTVAISYACMRCLGWILLAYTPGFPAAAKPDYVDDATNVQQLAMVQPATQAPDPTPAPAANPAPDDKVTADISIKGISGSANNALVTIQYGKKNYILSPGEGVTLSTDEGLVPVRLLGTDENNVTLAVRGQSVKYSVN